MTKLELKTKMNRFIKKNKSMFEDVLKCVALYGQAVVLMNNEKTHFFVAPSEEEAKELIEEKK